MLGFYFRICVVRLVVGVMCVVGLLPGTGWAEGTTYLIFGGDNSYPPYEYLDGQGTPTGFDVDITRAVAREMGILTSLRLMPWHEARSALQVGEVDVLMGMFRSPERLRHFSFSTPHNVASYAVFVTEGSPIGDLDDTRDRRVIVQKGDIGHDYLIQRGEPVEIVVRENMHEVLKALAAGEGDAALVSRLQGLMIIKDEGLDAIRAVGPPILQRAFCFAVRKGDERLLSLLNEGLSAIKASGQYDEIHAKWFGAYRPKEFNGKELLIHMAMVGGPLVAVALLFLLWSWALKRKVARRTEELSMANDILSRQIDERLQAERAFRESERRYREIFNTPNDAIILHDAETGAVVDINKPGLAMLGYGRDEILGAGFETLLSGEGDSTGDKAMVLFRQVALGDPRVVQWQGRRKDGTAFWVEVSLKVAHLTDQACVVSVGRDISARKEAEEKLSEEKERLAVTLRSIGDGVITSDVSGHVVLMNKVAEKLTGWTQNEAVGRPMAEVFRIINEKTRKPCENPVDKVLSTGNIITLANHTALIAKDGTERSIADSGAPIMDRTSTIVGVVLVFRDVTDENRMEEELLKVRKLESVGVLAGGIAHDFNNILTAVLGGVSLARTRCQETSETHRLLTDVLKACDRAKDLTQQLLTFSKGGAPVIRVASVVDVVRESAGFVLRGSRVRCETHFAEDLWPAEIDAGQISQVAQNLILNAVQAMPRGGVITIAAENHPIKTDQVGLLPLKGDRYVKLTFCDEGPGIPEEIRDRVFDPFFTTKKTGSGLGLATTHSIVYKHDGHIEVASTPGRGTCFTLYLPASEEALIEPLEAQPRPQAMGRGRILVMDDEEMVREVVEGLLVSMGYEVLLTASGEEAVAVYRERHGGPEPVDVVITDLTVAGAMGGLEAAGIILQWDPDARVVVSSGYSNDPVMADYMAHGFCAAIVKPYTHADLMAVVSGAMEG
ncbi:PAS domain S-box protein [Desulfoluna butyratoxydans]|uniref:histidine kinase n=1 Tax=Desulfoluna butyratoxydans TaxID=231438 RepID=A0A4U8YR79_9BACT|nr:transporter substrate-binding domain-containing protein [Desulfoluna butyratoxydans]VFQ46381.1 pas fold [Desulfoluna butyratoxydans]